ncbi:MAG TPA: MFS transporter [Rhabdochlamydiaceae bacterium]|jgi:MFS family permease|nr:MFS transporter [Rhabdochlamydiaceae bacterium]
MEDRFRFKWWALLGVSVLAFTAFLDATIVNTALPFIQTALNANILQLQWIANIFTIILSMTMIAIGKLADVWGRKKVFYYGVVVFGIAAFGAGLSTTVELLVFFRGLQAIGASTVFIASAALLSDVFPERERVRAISIYGGVTGFGLMIGPFLGGILISLLGWRWVFWINLPLIAAGLAACSFSLKGLSQTKHKINVDWWGLILLIFGLGALMYGIIGGAQTHWSSISGWIFLFSGIGALVLLIILDELRANPLLDLQIFKENLIVLAALSCALAGVVSTVFMFFDPLYLRILRDLSPFLIGLLIAVIPAAQAMISFVFDRSVKLFGVANLLFISTLAAFLAVILHRFIYECTPLLFLILPFFLLGVNWGLSNAAMITAVNQVIAPNKIGAALGTIATVWNIVGAILLATSTAVFHSIEVKASFLPAFHGAINFNIAFTTLILVCAIYVYSKLKKHHK